MSTHARRPVASLLRRTTLAALLMSGLAACGKPEPPAPAADAPAAAAPAAAPAAPAATPAQPAADPNDPTSQAGTTTVPGQAPSTPAPPAGAKPTGPIVPIPKLGEIKFTAAMEAEGKKHYFTAGCNACHGGTGGGGMCPPLINKIWVYGNDTDTLHALIKEGTLGMAGHGLTRIGHENVIGQMPPFGSVLNDQQINELIAYIHSLNKSLGDPAAAPKKQ